MKDIEKLKELQKIATNLDLLIIKTKNPITLSVEGIEERLEEIEKEKRDNPELFELKYYVGKLLNILKKERIIL